jgi:hypothetical protein
MAFLFEVDTILSKKRYLRHKGTNSILGHAKSFQMDLSDKRLTRNISKVAFVCKVDKTQYIGHKPVIL